MLTIFYWDQIAAHHFVIFAMTKGIDGGGVNLL